MSLHHFPRFRLSHLIQMISLLSTLGAALANPVSSPEIATIKSGKSIASAIVGNANSLQQQQQKSSPQDTHLNSLTVFATNFDSITSGNAQQPSGNFKPSYNYNSNSNSNYNSNSNNNYNSNSNTNYNSNKNYNSNSNSNNNYNSNSNDNNNYNSNNNNNNNDNDNQNYNSNSNNFINQNHHSYMPLPEIETNFTPMQQGTIQTSDLSQPVIMQYLPQTVHASDGIQYLQLIPTRPLMVPISPYIAGTPAGQISADVATTVSNNVGYHHHHHPPTLAAPNTIAEYATRTPPILSPQSPANVAAPAPSVLMDIPATHTYSLPPFAPQIMHPYRHFRINRDIKPKNLPPGLSLNMHEYMPSPHDPPRATFVRGRP